MRKKRIRNKSGSKIYPLPLEHLLDNDNFKRSSVMVRGGVLNVIIGWWKIGCPSYQLDRDKTRLQARMLIKHWNVNCDRVISILGEVMHRYKAEYDHVHEVDQIKQNSIAIARSKIAKPDTRSKRLVDSKSDRDVRRVPTKFVDPKNHINPKTERFQQVVPASSKVLLRDVPQELPAIFHVKEEGPILTK
jgi:hypothetical protein